MRGLVVVLTFWVAVVAVTTPAESQSAQRSTITGTVSDTQHAPIPGCVVTLAGSQLIGGQRAARTDASGHYAFTDLLPGTYEVTTSAPGMRGARRGDVVLPVETTYDVNFVVEIAHVAQAVEVQGTSALLDARRTSSPTVFPEAVLHDVPTARTLSSVLSLTPGVTTTPKTNGIYGEIAFGGTEGSNGFSVDGVSLVETSLGTEWTQPNYNWLEQVQVVALGASAEYGGFTGAIANGVLRSGSNRVSGLAEWLQVPRRWRAENLVNYAVGRERPANDQIILTWWDLNGQSGAPLVRDRLWVFAGINTFHHEYLNYAYAGPARTEERTSRALVKLDAAPGPNLRLQGFVTSDHVDSIGNGLSSYTPTLDSQADVFTRTHAWNARGTWTHGASVVMEFRGSGTFGSVDSEPHQPATRSGPSPEFDADTQSWCCNTVWFEENRRTPTVGATLTAFRSALLGSHEFRAGVEREHSPVAIDTGVPTDQKLTLSNGHVIAVEDWAGDHLRSTTDRLSVFAEDRWTLGRRVTLEPGLRIDWNSGSLPSQHDVITTTGVGPRMGVAWDVTGRQSTIVRAHYGRYFDPLYGALFEGFDPTGFAPHVAYTVTPDGLVETDRFYSDYVYLRPHTTLWSHLKQPRMDQWVVALEQALGPHTTAGVQFVRRYFGDFIGYADRNNSVSQYVAMDPGPDGVTSTADDGGPVVVYLGHSTNPDVTLTNPPNAYRRYRGVQLTLTRRLASRWQAQASWSWSRTKMTVDDLYHTNAGYWSLSGGGEAFALRTSGRPSFDFSEFKADGSYRAPWLGGFTLGGVFRWRNGARWSRLVFQIEPFPLVFSPEAPGSRGTPSVMSLDARVEKTFRLSGRARLGAYVDVFNATNVQRVLGYVPFSGPRFLLPNSTTDPRTARLGMRVEF